MTNEQQKLFEEDLNAFLQRTRMDTTNVVIKESEDQRMSILCAICCGVIGCAIWDGMKWVWEYYEHNCPGPTPSPTPAPDICPLCHEKIIPGKPHYCR